MVSQQDNMAEKQYVIFSLGHEEFGVNIGEVREIIRSNAVTRLPNVPAHIQGVINLRGNIIVVVDLAMKLSLPAQETTGDTRVIIIEVGGNTVGMIVDSAKEVLRLPVSQIQPPPPVILGRINSNYIENVGIVGERLLILLDLTKIVDSQESKTIEQLQQAASRGVAQSAQQPIQQSTMQSSQIVQAPQPIQAAPSIVKAALRNIEEQANQQAMPQATASTVSAAPQTVSQTAPIQAQPLQSQEPQQPAQKQPLPQLPEVPKSNIAPATAPVTESVTPTVPAASAVHPTLQNVPPEYHFITHEGQPLKNIHELLGYVRNLDEGTFKQFVNDEKNDFYNWIFYIIKDEDLAQKIQSLKNKDDVTKEIMDRILKIMLGNEV